MNLADGLNLGGNPQSSAQAQGGGAVVKDTDTARFEADVIHASMQVPVLVQFTAAWCGPCKQLGPVLEKAVMARQGRVQLVRVDIDASPEIAQALRVQSVPMVYGFFQGRPVDMFQGAQAQSAIDQFIDRLEQAAGSPGADQKAAIDDAIAQIEQVLADGDPRAAAAMASQVLSQLPDEARVAALLLKAMVAAGEAARAAQMAEQFPPGLKASAEVTAALEAIRLAEQAEAAQGQIPALEARIATDATDHEARIELARILFGSGQREAAIDHLLESIRMDAAWQDGRAREALLELFKTMGNADPLTVAGRRKLSSMLFS